MPAIQDGPATSLFRPLSFQGNASLTGLPSTALSPGMAQALEHAPSGECVCWGIPFAVESVALLANDPVTVQLPATHAEWLVFLHTSDSRPLPVNEDGFISPMRGRGQLGEHAADYIVLYADGSEERLAILRRRHIGAFTRGWGENCFEAVAQNKPQSERAHHEQVATSWGRSQTRATAADDGRWVNWLWAWQNPHPDREIVGLRLEPVSGVVVLSAISAGNASALPLRWESRRKALLALPEGIEFQPDLDDRGLLAQIRLDMGQVISAHHRCLYPNENWATSYNNQLPDVSTREIVIEYTAHNDASFYLWDGRQIPVKALLQQEAHDTLQPVAPATQRVTLRTLDKASGQPVPVKLHVHGQAGEYLAPVDRHRMPNPAWYEDYSVDFTHLGRHHTTYITGETDINLPLGQVFIEISKGFEIKPIRQVVQVTPATKEITIDIEKVLPWRERGWVTADTHVHFLTPQSAMLEGSGEGVNVVNLLSSQWGELMTNVGDFDGRTTWGSHEAGGDGEYLVRVGTENRQHIMGHISLLGYRGRAIAPMTTGGPDESALGDPIESLLTEWARQCQKQGGIVVLPHFPNPRAEHAASIVSGVIDGIETTSWGSLYAGIDPYTLSDYYRYLNCGYQMAIVAGTDKMSASTAVGTVRTYAHIAEDRPFDYDAWMDAVRRAETFATYGPLLEFSVDGQPMGSRIEMSANGGTVDVTWQVASVTVPISRVELVVNGEIRESVASGPWEGSGSWSFRVDKSSWLALLVRGHYADQPEIIAAHSSPVMVAVQGSEFLAAADAVTILEQIEGAIAYLDTVGTRKDDRTYKRMRLVLESAYQSLHDRMHRMGKYHDHNPVQDHPEHH